MLNSYQYLLIYLILCITALRGIELHFSDLGEISITSFDNEEENIKYCIALDINDIRCLNAISKYANEEKTREQIKEVAIVISNMYDCNYLKVLVAKLSVIVNLSVNIISLQSLSEEILSTFIKIGLSKFYFVDDSRPNSFNTTTLSLNIHDFMNNFNSHLEAQIYDLCIFFSNSLFNSALLLSCSHHNIPIAHIGVGQHNRDMNTNYNTQEFQRLISDTFCDLCFTSTKHKQLILHKNGINLDQILVVGSLIIETQLQQVPATQSTIFQKIRIEPNSQHYLLLSTEIKDYSYLEFELLALVAVEMTLTYPALKIIFLINNLHTTINNITTTINNQLIQTCTKLFHNKFNIIPIFLPSHFISTEFLQLSPTELFSDFQSLLQYSDLFISDSSFGIEETLVYNIPTILIGEVADYEEVFHFDYIIRVPIVLKEILFVIKQSIEKLSFLNFPKNNNHNNFNDNNNQKYLLFGDGNTSERITYHILRYLQLETYVFPPESKLEYDVPLPDILPRLVTNVDNSLTVLNAFTPYKHPYKLFHPPTTLPTTTSTTTTDTVTVILSQHTLNNTLSQLNSLCSQTYLHIIDAIIIYQIENPEINLDFLANFTCLSVSSTPTSNNDNPTTTTTPPIHIITVPIIDYKTYGRFTLPLLLDTSYTLILDDTIHPQRKWIEYALSVSKEYHSIVGCKGHIISGDSEYVFLPPVDFTIEVDYVTRCWLFQSSWIRYLWWDPVPSWEGGEDLGISAAAWKHSRIRTVMPGMSYDTLDRWGDLRAVTSTSDPTSDSQSSSAGTQSTGVTGDNIADSYRAVNEQGGGGGGDEQQPQQPPNWSLVKYWILEKGWVPSALREVHVGRNSRVCRPPFPAACGDLYSILFKDKYYHSKALAPSLHNYITTSEAKVQIIYLVDTNKDVCQSLKNNLKIATQESEIRLFSEKLKDMQCPAS